LIGERWQESEAIEKIDQGYREGVFKKYGNVLGTFEEMEQKVIAGEERNK
jgi:xylulokinase